MLLNSIEFIFLRACQLKDTLPDYSHNSANVEC